MQHITQIKKPTAPITQKQKAFLRVLVSRTYADKPETQQTLLKKLEHMTVQEASSAIKSLL
jgi:hypothetical protein